MGVLKLVPTKGFILIYLKRKFSTFCFQGNMICKKSEYECFTVF